MPGSGRAQQFVPAAIEISHDHNALSRKTPRPSQPRRKFTTTHSTIPSQHVRSLVVLTVDVLPQLGPRLRGQQHSPSQHKFLLGMYFLAPGIIHSEFCRPDTLQPSDNRRIITSNLHPGHMWKRRKNAVPNGFFPLGGRVHTPKFDVSFAKLIRRLLMDPPNGLRTDKENPGPTPLPGGKETGVRK